MLFVGGKYFLMGMYNFVMWIVLGVFLEFIVIDLEVVLLNRMCWFVLDCLMWEGILEEVFWLFGWVVSVFDLVCNVSELL